MHADLKPVAEDLYLIPLTPPLPGFEEFISAWLYLGNPRFLVDVGPASTADSLFACLDRIDVTHLDYIFLTHIHLDHAGAIGAAAARFGDAPIVCQAAGIPHLIDPTRLWEGTKNVLGEIAMGYGPIAPVAAERLVDAADFDDAAIRPVLTPGHAAHHVSYVMGDFLFAGETGGVWRDLGAGREYLRPATPPRFYLDTALASLEKLMTVAPRWLCYGHFGMGDGARERLTRQYDQLLYWERAIERMVTPGKLDDDLEEKCLRVLLEKDPLLRNFHNLPPAIQDRETYFLKNSIRGFLGWLKNK